MSSAWARTCPSMAERTCFLVAPRAVKGSGPGRRAGKRSGACRAAGTGRPGRAAPGVPAQARALGQGAQVLGQAGGVRRQVVEHPVVPGAGRGVGVVHDQGQALGRGRHAGNGQGRRDVRVVAGVAGRDGLAGTKGAAGQAQAHGVTSPGVWPEIRSMAHTGQKTSRNFASKSSRPHTARLPGPAQAGAALEGLHRVGHEHGDGHGADAPGTGVMARHLSFTAS